MHFFQSKSMPKQKIATFIIILISAILMAVLTFAYLRSPVRRDLLADRNARACFRKIGAGVTVGRGSSWSETLWYEGKPGSDISKCMQLLPAMKHLKSLRVMNSAVSEKSMKSIFLLQELRSLSLRGSTILGNGPFSLVKLPKLERLDLSETGMDYAKIKKLFAETNSRIDDLDISHTGVDDALLEIILENANISILKISSTFITDKSLEVLAKIKTLDYLDISNTVVSGRAIVDFESKRPDVYLGATRLNSK